MEGSPGSETSIGPEVLEAVHRPPGAKNHKIETESLRSPCRHQVILHGERSTGTLRRGALCVDCGLPLPLPYAGGPHNFDSMARDDTVMGKEPHHFWRLPERQRFMSINGSISYKLRKLRKIWQCDHVYFIFLLYIYILFYKREIRCLANLPPRPCPSQ